MSNRVTEEQQHAIRVMACLTLLHGRAPALGELAAVWGISKPAVIHRLEWLDKKGLCCRRARTLTEQGLRAAIGPRLAISSTPLT